MLFYVTTSVTGSVESYSGSNTPKHIGNAYCSRELASVDDDDDGLAEDITNIFSRDGCNLATALVNIQPLQ